MLSNRNKKALIGILILASQLVISLFAGCGTGEEYIIYVHNFTTIPATFELDGESYKVSGGGSTITITDVESGSHNWAVNYQTEDGSSVDDSGTIDVQSNMSFTISWFGVEWSLAATYEFF